MGNMLVNADRKKKLGHYLFHIGIIAISYNGLRAWQVAISGHKTISQQ
jgi:hypothetical protein